MLRATLRSLLARKLRLLLSGIAVILGVAFVSGSFVLTDTMRKSFDAVFADINKSISVAVAGKNALGGSDTEDVEPVPQAVLDKIRTVDGVEDVSGYVASRNVVLTKKDGKAYKTGGAPILGISIDPSSPLEPFKVVRGTPPHGLHEAALDVNTAKRAHLQIGDTFRVQLKGPVTAVTLTAVINLDIGSAGGASNVAMDPPSAQQLFGTPGTWSAVVASADPGVSDTVLRDRIAKVLPPAFEALTQQQKIDQQSKDLRQGLKVFNIVLQVFALISLLVAAFLIFNTFTMLAAQRTRELALMRALGASRGQVTRSVLVEATIVGAVSSFIGFGAGVGVGLGMRSLLGALGIQLPGGSAVVQTRTFVVAMLIGLVVTLVAALVPARRAARVAPVQAMRDATPAEQRSLRRRTVVGSAVVLLGTLELFSGLRGKGDIKAVGIGAGVAFVGALVVSPVFVRRMVEVIGAPFARLGTPSRMGRANAIRSPRRTSATASALMIGLTLVAVISTFGQSVKASLAAYVHRSLGADFVVHTDNFDRFSPVVATRLQARPELTQVAAYRFGNARVNGTKVDIQGVESGPLVQSLRVQTLQGDISSIDRGQLAVSQNTARDRHFSVGQRVDVIWSRTGNKPMTVGAVYATNLFAGDYLVGGKVVDDNVTQKLVGVVTASVKPGVSAAAGRKAVDSILKDFPNLDVDDASQLIARQRKGLDQLLNTITAMLLLSVLIAVLGIVNTLALSVVERTRELGLLRAVGLSRRQLRRMIRAESVLIGLYGAVLGVVIGVALGAAMVHALRDQGIDTFAVPVLRLLLVLVAGGVAGIVAAALPARRAARLNVLAAIAEE